jgi:hypothetical protein
MDKHAQYMGYSNTCAELSRTAISPEQRVMLLHIAETWKRLADIVKMEDDLSPARVLH